MLDYPKSLHSYNPIPYGCVFYQNPALLRAPVFKSLDSYSHTCTVTGTTKAGNVWVMDGDDVITVPNHAALIMATSDWSIGAWVNTGTTAKDIVSKYGAKGYILWISGDKARCYITGVGGSLGISTTTSVTDSAWHLAFVTCDKSSATGLSVYLDVTPETTGNPTSVGDMTDTAALTIGNGGNGFFNGSLGEVWIYDRCLSTTEVPYIYNKTKGWYL